MDQTHDIPDFISGYRAANNGEGFLLVPMETQSPAWVDGFTFPIRAEIDP